MGENKQKGFKQTNLGVLAKGKVCVTMGMGCGKKAVPEARGVPESLCYSRVSGSLGHCSCLEAWLDPGLGSIWDRAAWWLLVQHCILSIPPCSAVCCWGLVLAGCTGAFVVRVEFFPHWIYLAPQCSEASSFPRVISGFLWLLGCAGDWMWPHS